MIEDLRERLRIAYTEFTSKYGFLNKSRNRTIVGKDTYGYKICASVEVKLEHGIYAPADVLQRSNKGVVEQFKSENPVEVLSYTMGMYGKVNLEMIADITDKSIEEVLNELGDLVYLNPATMEWEDSSKYLSGNVYAKLQVAEQVYSETNNEHVKRSLEAIREIQVEKIPYDLLDFQLGERWVPLVFYKDFCEWLFETGVEITYLEASDVFKIECRNMWQSSKITREYMVRSKGRVTLYGMDLLEHAIENTSPYLTYTDRLGNKVPDNDAIQLANDKIEDIRKKFTEFLNDLPEERKNELVDKYNNTYNCYRLRQYDGSHMLLPDINMESLAIMGVKEIRNAQKDGIWRIIQQMGGIIDWEVGAGKSLLQVIAAHEMKRMGIRRKPAMLCLKANIADMVKTYRLAYPHAKILAPSEQDFEKKNRVRLFHEIKNNDWDCVIMTHDQFGKIPQSPEIQEEVMREEAGNLEADLEAVKTAGAGISRSMRKGLENRKASLDVKLQTLRYQIENKQDDDVTFNDMNIDHLFVDESHRHKNLLFTTRHERVAGLGNTQGSQKALNMLFAIRELQKRFDSDLQATFLSGTPISNSLTEMYLLFKYLRPNELVKQGIRNFDSWAAVYAKKTTDFEFSVTNQIIAKERFRHFIKVPELALFYNEIADYRTNKSINIDKPEMVEELVAIKPTEDQQEFIHNLILFAKTGEGHYIGRKPLTPAEDKARMLIATNYAKKMSTDMRLIDEVKYDDHPGNKISVCCEKVVEFHRKFRDNKGTQLIFCDLGVPDNIQYDNGDGVKYHRWTVYQAIKNKLVEEYMLPEHEIVFIHDYNEKTRSKLFKQINDGVVRIMIGSTDKAGTGVNVQQRVVAVHDLDIPWKPAELEQRGGRGARQGNWLAKLEQENKVYRYIYAVEQSLDTYKFTLLKNKQTFIAQMKNNELQVRSIDEGSFDEGTGMNFAEYIAVLSGDNTLLEKAKIDKKLAVLENLKVVHYREQHNNKYLLEHKLTRIEEVVEIRDTLVRDSEQYDRLLQRDSGGNRLNPLKIYALEDELKKLQIQRDAEKLTKTLKKQEKQLLRKLKMKVEKEIITEGEGEEGDSEIKDDSQVIGEYLIKLWTEFKPKVGEVSEHIGELYGFNCYIERQSNQNSDAIMSRVAGSNNVMFTNRLYAQHKESGLKYLFNHGVPNRTSDKIASRMFLNSLEKISGLLRQYTEEKERLEIDIKNLSVLDVKPFAKNDEIENLQRESKRLQGEISQKINGEKVAVAV